MATAAKSRKTASTTSETHTDAADSTAWLRNDGVLENAITGLNDPEYDKTVHTVIAAPKRLTYIDQQNLYEGSWICRRICDAYPIEGTREWVDVTLGGNAKPELATKFMQYQERLDIKDIFKLGQTWANIYKGAAAIIHVDDGREPHEPINRANVRSILDIEVLDFQDIRPNTTENMNPLRPDYYELVNRSSLSTTADGKPNNFRNYHPDRVIRFDGFALPPKAMLRNQNWGGSLLDSVYTAFNRYESGNAAAANMVQDFNVFIYALKNLGNLIGANDEKSLLTLRNRLKSLRLSMSNLKGLVLDADGESASFISRNFAGLADVLDRFRDELIGASGLPHTAVFGDAAGGLGSTGESEEVTWAKMVNQFQETVFRKKLRPVFELIWLAKDGPTKGKIPDDWSFSFNPLVQESEKDKLETRKSQSDIDNTYLSAGVVTKDEVRQSRFGGSDYSYETTLDAEAWKKAQEQDQFDFSGMGLGDGGDGGGDGGETPPEDDPNGGAPGGAAANGNGAIANGNGKAKVTRDSADSRLRVEKMQGLSLDVTHNVGDWRFGQPMAVEYARIRGSYGHAKDGRAHDVVKGPNPNSTKLFKFYQKNPATGLLDETKYGIGFDDIMSARDGWASMLPGGIHSPLFGSVDDADWSELQPYRQDCGGDCDCEPCQAAAKKAKKTPLLRLRRKQKPFGRELELIEDEPDEDSDRTTTETGAPKRSRGKTTKQKPKTVGDADEESDRVDGADRADAATKSKNAGKGKPCGEGSISPDKECHIGEQGQKPATAKKGGVNPLLIGAGVAVAGLGVAAIATSSQPEPVETSEAFVARYYDKSNPAVAASKRASVAKIQQKVPGLSEEEAVSVDYYSGVHGGYSPMNFLLRHGRSYDEKSVPAKDLKRQIHNLVSVLDKLPSYEPTAANPELRRYIRLNEAQMDAYSEGSLLIDPGFSSTTSQTEPLDPISPVAGFARMSNVAFHIKPKQVGSSGKNLSAASSISVDEGEILYPPGTQFRLLKKRDGSVAFRGSKPQAITIFEMEEV